MATTLAELKGEAHDQHTLVHEKPSIDEWVLGVLQQHGAQTLDQMGQLLPQMN